MQRLIAPDANFPKSQNNYRFSRNIIIVTLFQVLLFSFKHVDEVATCTVNRHLDTTLCPRVSSFRISYPHYPRVVIIKNKRRGLLLIKCL